MAEETIIRSGDHFRAGPLMRGTDPILPSFQDNPTELAVTAEASATAAASTKMALPEVFILNPTAA